MREKTTDGFDAKINYTLTAKDQISGRVSFMRPVVFDPGQFGQYGGPANGGFAGTGTNTAYSAAGTWTRVVNTATVLDVRGGLNYYKNTTITTGDGLTTSQDVGIPGANINQYTSGVSSINITGLTGPSPNNGPLLGFSASQPWDRSEKTWNIVSSLTKMKSNHTIKMGGEWRKNTDKLLQTQDAGGPRGNFAFTSSGTGNPAETASTQGMANAFASFLLDWPSTVQRDLKVIDAPGTKHWAVATFVQDKWQVRSNVTMDLGLRWEFYKPLQGIQGQGTLSNYDPATNTLNVAGYGSTTNSLNIKNYYKNIAPRIGATWRLNEQTVVRAGYGASAIPFPDNRYAFNFPVKQNYNGLLVNGFQNAGSMATGFPAPALANIPSNGVIPISGSLLNSTYDVIPNRLHEGTLHSWNVAFQRQLPYGFTADVAYVGSKGVNLVMDVDLNASLVYGSGNNGRPQFAPFGRTGTSRERSNLGKSRYNGLQMKSIAASQRPPQPTPDSCSRISAQENTGSAPIDFNQERARSTWTTHNVANCGDSWGPEAVAERRNARQDHRRLAVERHLRRPVGSAAGDHRRRHCSTRRARRPRESERLNTILGGLGPEPSVFRSDHYRSRPRPGQYEAAAARQSGYWELGRRFKRFATAAYGDSARLVRVTNSVRGNPNTGFSTATGNTFGQITGQRARSGRSGLACASALARPQMCLRVLGPLGRGGGAGGCFGCYWSWCCGSRCSRCGCSSSTSPFSPVALKHRTCSVKAL